MYVHAYIEPVIIDYTRKEKDTPKNKVCTQKKKNALRLVTDSRLHIVNNITGCSADPPVKLVIHKNPLIVLKRGSILEGSKYINTCAGLHGVGLRKHRSKQYFVGFVWAGLGYRQFHGINFGWIGIAHLLRARFGRQRGLLFFAGPRNRPELREIPRQQSRGKTPRTALVNILP